LSAALPVAIVGATGVTGAFAFDEAQRRGLAPVAVGRNAAKLGQFLKLRGLPADRLRIADVHDAPALRRALSGISVVISTVAPFSDNGFPVARVAAELGLGYTDSTGEGPFMQRLIDELDPVAVTSGATLCTGNGAAAFVGDTAMRWITDRRADSSGALLYEIRDYRPSYGTTQSYLKHIMPGGGALVRDGTVRFAPFAAFSGRVAGLSGIHSVVPDPLVISRYWPARRLDGLFRAPAYLRPVVAAATSLMLWQPMRDLLLKLPLERWLAYDPAADLRSTVTVIAECRSAEGAVRRRRLRGRAIYPLTGQVLAATAQAMLQSPRRPAGVRAASEMFASFEQALEWSGLEELPLPPQAHAADTDPSGRLPA
jgi:hypothetical protein